MRGDAPAGLSLIAALGPIAELTTAVQVHTWYLRAMATSELAGGDPASALGHAREAIGLEPAGANAPNSAWAGIQAACALRDADQVEAVLRATSGLRGRWFEQVRRTGRAMAASQRSEDTAPALAGVLEALDEWERMDLPLDHASATIAAMWVTAAPAVLSEHVDRARATLERLGARGLLARLDAALAAAEQQAG